MLCNNRSIAHNHHTNNTPYWQQIFQPYPKSNNQQRYKVDYIKGFGKLSGPNTVSVALNEGGEQNVDAKNIILAVGSEVRLSLSLSVIISTLVASCFM